MSVLFEQKFQLIGTSKVGLESIFKHLYLNEYAELDGKMSNIVFLHDFLLACKISIVRTLATYHQMWSFCINDCKYPTKDNI